MNKREQFRMYSRTVEREWLRFNIKAIMQGRTDYEFSVLPLSSSVGRLTRTARCQVLIKIIYRFGEQVVFSDISSYFKKFLKKKDFPVAWR